MWIVVSVMLFVISATENVFFVMLGMDFRAWVMKLVAWGMELAVWGMELVGWLIEFSA